MAWRSGQSYSQDLRDRVLAAVDGGKSAYEVAPLFQVSVSYIYKAQGRRRATGETTVKPRPGRPGQKLAAHLEALQAKVKAEPDATLAELQAWVLADLGASISIGGLWNTLERLGLSLKKRVHMRPSKSGPT
jgi:transposase